MDLTSLISLVRAHAWVALAWFVITAFINTVFCWKGRADLEALAARRPFLAVVAKCLRHWGIEPVEGIKVIAALFSKNSPPPSAGPDDPPPAVPAATVTLR